MMNWREQAAIVARHTIKPSASRIERMLAKVEARLVPPPRKCLSAIVDDIDDEGPHC